MTAKRRHPAAGAYARAILEVGLDRDQATEYELELCVLGNEVFASGDMKVFLESPKIPRADKKRALDSALTGKVSDAVLNLVKMLVDRNRQELLGQISEVYKEMHDQIRGRVHVRLSSASPMALELQQQLVKRLGDKLQREIVAEADVNEELLGGMTVQVGDMMIDGSVRTRLNVIKEALASQRLGSDLIDENQGG